MQAVEGRTARLRLALLLSAIALLAFQLRGPLVALAPVAKVAEAGWGVTPATFGLLTTVPLLCFSLATPLAPLIARRIGAEAAIVVCLAGIVIATVLRSLDGFGVAIAAVTLLGLAVTIGNVLVPAVVRQDVPARGRPLATGLYGVAINFGTMLTSLTTVPVAQVLGWRPATAAWTVAGLATIGVWLVVLRRAGRHAPPAGQAVPAPFRPSGLAVLLGLVFAAQSFSYYAVTTWLPTLLADERGYSAAVAGSASAVFQVSGIVGAIGVPLLTLRLQPRTVLAVVGVLWVSLPVGLLLAPEQFLAVSVLGGIAQGGGFSAIMAIIAEAGGSVRGTTSLSAFVQSMGYLVAAIAPPVIGGVHQLTGGWTAPMLLVLGTTASFIVFGVTAATRAARPA